MQNLNGLKQLFDLERPNKFCRFVFAWYVVCRLT